MRRNPLTAAALLAAALAVAALLASAAHSEEPPRWLTNYADELRVRHACDNDVRAVYVETTPAEYHGLMGATPAEVEFESRSRAYLIRLSGVLHVGHGATNDPPPRASNLDTLLDARTGKVVGGLTMFDVDKDIDALGDVHAVPSGRKDEVTRAARFYCR